MKTQKKVNKSDWDGSDIILKRKICICQARGPSLVSDTKKKLLRFFTFLTFGHWQGAGRNSKFA